MSDSADTSELNEAALKCLFLEHLRRQRVIDQNSVIASEYGLGRVGRRIDLAIWAGEFIGIEFKSRFDTLKRLSWQLQAYLQCFDRVILVVDERHGKKALLGLPAPVELWTVNSLGDFTRVQSAGVIRAQTAQALSNLCSLVQLRRLTPATNNGAYRGRLHIATKELRIEDVYDVAIEGFKRAFLQSSRSFWNEVADGKIDPAAMLTLSRFAGSRSRRVMIQHDEQIFWQQWAEQAAESLRCIPEVA